MSTPKLREDEIAMPASPRASYVTTTRKMANQRYHYVAGGWAIWRRTADGSRKPVRLAVHTLCRQWVSMPILLGDAPFAEICDLCMLHQSRDLAAREASSGVDL